MPKPQFTDSEKRILALVGDNLPDGPEPYKAVAEQAWIDRVSLSATGYYRTPGIHYDPATGRGNPFYYFAFGGAVCEVELNGLTGEHRLLRVDILHDVGRSLAERRIARNDRATGSICDAILTPSPGVLTFPILKELCGPGLVISDEEALRAMAVAIARQQGNDGLWRANLDDPDQCPNPETSGTAFFCYAFAWGINC